ncbi:unannotated protein [freshwater metagenome]|uniref:Unannotated protein n=1 Tax=freshwater metagenome TaxID=449393 RepID=A0A6J7EV93_9ZZZZ
MWCRCYKTSVVEIMNCSPYVSFPGALSAGQIPLDHRLTKHAVGSGQLRLGAGVLIQKRTLPHYQDRVTGMLSNPRMTWDG